MADEQDGGRPDPSGGPGGALAALYRSHALYVQRKSGALSYVDDPSGVRSLLSTAFHKVTLNTQHSTLNTQQSTRNTQHATLNTQHATLNTQQSQAM